MATRARSFRRTPWATATPCSRWPPARWDGSADVSLIGALAADAMAKALVQAVTQATGLPNIPGGARSRRTVNLHLALLLAYSARPDRRSGCGSAAASSGAKDFFVAGRGLGPGLIFSTMLAANIGAGSTVGATGARLSRRPRRVVVGRIGGARLGRFWRSGSARRCVASPRRTTCAPSATILEIPLRPSVRGIVALLLWFGSLSILAGQLIAIALDPQRRRRRAEVGRLRDRRRR